jgi:hypothetical protein
MSGPAHPWAFWRSPAARIRMWGVLGTAALFVMELTAAALWYQAVFLRSPVPWAEMLIVMLLISSASYLLLSYMEGHQWRMPIRRAAFLLWILVAAFASLKLLLYPNRSMDLFELIGQPIRFLTDIDAPGEGFFHLLIIILLVWRGVSIARSQVTVNGVHTSFQFGLVLILLYGMIFAPLHPIEAMLGLYIFLFSGLISMSAARIANLSELRGGRVPRFGVGWLLSIMAAGLLVVGLALAAGYLISGRVVELLAFAVVIIIAILTALVMIVLSPLLAYLAELVRLLADLLEQVLERFRNLPFSQQIQGLLNTVNDALGKAIPYVLAGRGIFLLLILLTLVAVVLLALYLRKNREEPVEEAVSETASPGETPGLLQKLLQRLLQDARRLRLRGPAQLLAAARVRQIYRLLMALAQKLGAVRQLSTTPLEFLPALTRLFPTGEPDLRLITAAYLKVRYGEYPETRGELEQVEQAWERVRREGQKGLAARRSHKNRS